MSARRLDPWELKEARRVGDFKDMLELVEMAGYLAEEGWDIEMIANSVNLPIQGHVTPLERLYQGFRITRCWPEEALVVARKYNADWHSLYEPARWWDNDKVEREELVAFALDRVANTGRWPRTDHFRREFGFADGHKPALHPNQGALL